MHAPSDKRLADWIRELERDGRLYRFYKTREWRALRDEVLEDHHCECARCKERGILSRAYTVHHVHEVRHRPDLALTRWLDGEEILEPVCLRCHNEEHGRFVGNTKSKAPPITDERW